MSQSVKIMVTRKSRENSFQPPRREPFSNYPGKPPDAMKEHKIRGLREIQGREERPVKREGRAENQNTKIQF